MDNRSVTLLQNREGELFERNDSSVKNFFNNMNGEGKSIVYRLEQLLLFQGVFDFIFGVHNSGGIVYCNLHIE